MSTDVTTAAPGEGQPGTTPATPAQSPDQYASRFWGALIPVIMSTIPSIVEAVTRDAQTRGAVPGMTQQEAQSRFFSQIMDCLPPVIDDLIPTLVDAIQQLQQQRGGAITTLDDPQTRGWLTDVLGTVATTVAAKLPDVIQMFTRSPQPPPLYSEDVSQRFLPLVLGAILPAVASSLPQLISLVTGQRVGPSETRSRPHWDV